MNDNLQLGTLRTQVRYLVITPSYCDNLQLGTLVRGLLTMAVATLTLILTLALTLTLTSARSPPPADLWPSYSSGRWVSSKHSHSKYRCSSGPWARCTLSLDAIWPRPAP